MRSVRPCTSDDPPVITILLARLWRTSTSQALILETIRSERPRVRLKGAIGRTSLSMYEGVGCGCWEASVVVLLLLLEVALGAGVPLFVAVVAGPDPFAAPSFCRYYPSSQR